MIGQRGLPDLIGLRILVVEDVYIIAADLQLALEDAGAEVVGPVASVRAGLDAIAAGPAIDAAVLDVDLSGEKVFPLAEVLAGTGVPFLFVTGYDKDIIPAEHAHVPRREKPTTAEVVATALFSEGAPRRRTA